MGFVFAATDTSCTMMYGQKAVLTIFWLDPCAMYDNTSWMGKLVGCHIATGDTYGNDFVCSCTCVSRCRYAKLSFRPPQRLSAFAQIGDREHLPQFRRRSILSRHAGLE
jgi:hypothetical protein